MTRSEVEVDSRWMGALSPTAGSPRDVTERMWQCIQETSHSGSVPGSPHTRSPAREPRLCSISEALQLHPDYETDRRCSRRQTHVRSDLHEVTNPRHSRGLYRRWPLKGACSRRRKNTVGGIRSAMLTAALSSAETRREELQPVSSDEERTAENVKRLLPPRQSRGTPKRART